MQYAVDPRAQIMILLVIQALWVLIVIFRYREWIPAPTCTDSQYSSFSEAYNLALATIPEAVGSLNCGKMLPILCNFKYKLHAFVSAYGHGAVKTPATELIYNTLSAKLMAGSIYYFDQELQAESNTIRAISMEAEAAKLKKKQEKASDGLLEKDSGN